VDSAPVLTRSYRRPRAFLRVAGPDAAAFLERMVSNDVVSLAAGESREALLLTPKARVIAPLVVLRRGDDDFLLLTEPELGEVVRSQLLRARFAAKCEVEPEEHASAIVLGEGRGIPTLEYGMPAREVLDAGEADGDVEELERLRIEAGTPRFGREIDDRVLPAEAGLVERAVSFSKGCYPGQEPIARLHYRGRANRRLVVLELEEDHVPAFDSELRLGDKVVGRVTSAVAGLALGYVRREVEAGAALEADGRRATVRRERST
jgi:folate-binding protein YgfZ